MPYRPTLRQLSYLVALYDLRNFSRAADRCFVTQSTLSAGLRELERGLGLRVVERTKRSVRFTPLGEAVVGRARDILHRTDDLMDLVQASAEPLSGPLRLGMIPTIGPFLLPRVLPTLKTEHPALRLYLREDLSDRLLRRLVEGELDILLLAFPFPVADGITVVQLADDPFTVVFPQGHAFAAREFITPDDLVGEDLLLLDEGHCLRAHALSACSLEGVHRPDEFRATSLLTLAEMVDVGLGLTLVPKLAIDGGLLRGLHVGARPLEGAGAGRTVGLAWRASSVRSEEFHMLGDYVRDELATPLPPMRAQTQ